MKMISGGNGKGAYGRKSEQRPRMTARSSGVIRSETIEKTKNMIFKRKEMMDDGSTKSNTTNDA